MIKNILFLQTISSWHSVTFFLLLIHKLLFCQQKCILFNLISVFPVIFLSKRDKTKQCFKNSFESKIMIFLALTIVKLDTKNSLVLKISRFRSCLTSKCLYFRHGLHSFIEDGIILVLAIWKCIVLHSAASFSQFQSGKTRISGYYWAA